MRVSTQKTMTMPATTQSAGIRASTDQPYVIPPDHYRLPAATRLGPVRLQVADLDRSLAFYEGVLGLRLLELAGADARLGAPGSDDVLVALHARPGATPVPRRGRLGLYHFAVLLPSRADLGRFVRHLSETGVTAGAADHLFSEALYLTDPDGLGVEVYADRPRAAWPLAGDVLAGDTQPLDLHSLDRDAGETRWTGAPAGTTIGHVHLYVDRLEDVEAFYHRGLGFDRLRLPFPGALFLSAGGYHHHLGTNTWAAGAPRAGPGDARLLAWTVVVPAASDADAAAQSLAEAGSRVTRTGEGYDATDPWGNGLHITHDRAPAGASGAG
jgi:catechol 2,3-dioxygenase